MIQISKYKYIGQQGLLLMFIFLLSSCVQLDRAFTTVTDHKSHPSFTYQDVTAGGVLIAGVTFKNLNSDINNSIKASNFFSEKLSDKRKEYRVSSISSGLVTKIGRANYQRILQEYNNNRWVDPSLLSAIRDNVDERYIILARIENDVAKKNSESRVNEKWKKHRKGKKYTLTRTSKRNMTGSYDVFDLAQDIIVWSGTTKESVSNKEFYKINSLSNTETLLASTTVNLLTGTIKTITQESQYSYPEIPSDEQAHKQLFAGPSAHMPHVKD